MDTPPPTEPDDGDDHRMPGRVMGFVIAAAAALLIAVVVLLVGGGHGPSRHLPGGDDRTTQSPEGHTPPFDHR